MGFHIGDKEVTALHFYRKAVDRVMLGDVQVWPSAPSLWTGPCAIQDPEFAANHSDTAWLEAHAAQFGTCTDFTFAFRDHPLTSFPVIDTRSGRVFRETWRDCTFTQFPLLNFANPAGVDLDFAWHRCSNLTSFPQIDTRYVTNIIQSWSQCVSLAGFPLLDFRAVAANNFEWAWAGSPLSPKSRENVFVALDNTGKTGVTTSVGGSGGTPAARAAWDRLIAKGWHFEQTDPPPA